MRHGQPHYLHCSLNQLPRWSRQSRCINTISHQSHAVLILSAPYVCAVSCRGGARGCVSAIAWDSVLCGRVVWRSVSVWSPPFKIQEAHITTVLLKITLLTELFLSFGIPSLNIILPAISSSYSNSPYDRRLLLNIKSCVKKHIRPRGHPFLVVTTYSCVFNKTR